MSDTVQISERLAPEQAKREVERVRTLNGSSDNERVGVQPHCEGETRNVTTENDDVLNASFLIPEVLLLPPPIKESGDDAAPSKMPAYTYYDQICVYSALEVSSVSFIRRTFWLFPIFKD